MAESAAMLPNARAQLCKCLHPAADGLFLALACVFRMLHPDLRALQKK